MMLKKATENLDDDDAVYIYFGHGGDLFSFSRLQSRTINFELQFHDLLFADDVALVAKNERALEHLLHCFIEAAQRWTHGQLKKRLKSSTSLHPGKSIALPR